MVKSRLLTVAAAVLACVLAAPTAWATDTETGAPDVDNSSDGLTYTADEQQANAIKEARFQEVMQILDLPQLPAQCIPSCQPPTTIGTADPSTLYFEGQGNLDSSGVPKKYTCGPSATRNLLSAIGAPDPGEKSLENWEDTSSQTGTVFANIVRTLNGRYKNYGSWAGKKPDTPKKLLGRVVTDVFYYDMPLVSNVQTRYLSFWNGHSAKHYNLISGYNTDSSKLRYAEEWNTTKNGVTGYGNPYGYHMEPVANGWNALHFSPSQSITF